MVVANFELPAVSFYISAEAGKAARQALNVHYLGDPAVNVYDAQSGRLIPKPHSEVPGLLDAHYRVAQGLLIGPVQLMSDGTFRVRCKQQ